MFSVPPYTLRAATEDDLAFQRQLYDTTREDELAAVHFPPEMKEQFLAMQFEAQTLHYRTHYGESQWEIIELAGQRIGRIILYRSQVCHELMDIALLPAHRGQGIGTRLIQLIQAEAAEKKKLIRLYTNTGERSARLYLRLGFQIASDDGLHTEMTWQG